MAARPAYALRRGPLSSEQAARAGISNARLARKRGQDHGGKADESHGIGPQVMSPKR